MAVGTAVPELTGDSVTNLAGLARGVEPGKSLARTPKQSRERLELEALFGGANKLHYYLQSIRNIVGQANDTDSFLRRLANEYKTGLALYYIAKKLDVEDQLLELESSRYNVMPFLKTLRAGVKPFTKGFCDIAIKAWGLDDKLKDILHS